jgi:hypothetical protein
MEVDTNLGKSILRIETYLSLFMAQNQPFLSSFFMPNFSLIDRLCCMLMVANVEKINLTYGFVHFGLIRVSLKFKGFRYHYRVRTEHNTYM